MKQLDYYISFISPQINDNIGGVQKLYIDLISFYCKNNYKNIRLYDFKNGFIKRKLDELNIYNYQYVEIEPKFKKIDNQGNEIFIINGFLFLIYPILFSNKNYKILVWDLYYKQWSDLGRITKYFNFNYMKRSVCDVLKRKNGIIFMEKLGSEEFKKCISKDVNMNDRILPVCIEIDHKLKINNNIGKVINIGCIGRAVGWKIYSIKKLIQELEKYNIKYQIYIYTNDMEKFKNILGKFQNINYREGLIGNNLLNKIILDNINLGYSMGTSALILGSLHIPVIIADFSFKEIPADIEAKYNLLYENEGYNLGMDYEKCNMNNKRNINALINYIKENYEECSKRTFDYIKEYHSIDSIAIKLIKYLNTTELKYNDFNIIIKAFYLIKYYKDVLYYGKV